MEPQYELLVIITVKSVLITQLHNLKFSKTRHLVFLSSGKNYFVKNQMILFTNVYLNKRNIKILYTQRFFQCKDKTNSQSETDWTACALVMVFSW